MSTRRGEFLVRLANLLRPAGDGPAAGTRPLRIHSVAVVTDCTQAEGSTAGIKPEILLEVRLEDGSVFRLSARDVTGQVPEI